MKRLLLTRVIGNVARFLPLTFLALVILTCPFSVSAQTEFPSIKAFLKSTLKGADRLRLAATGDLNGDGLLDWSGVIHRKQKESSPTYQLYVLLRLSKGGYGVAEKSIEEEVPGMGCCWVDKLAIRRSSIYVQNNAKTVSVMEEVTHQFKLHEGEWRLVGIKISYADESPGAPETIDTDMNMLTGSVIVKSQKGKKKPVVKNLQNQFATFLLKDFDFSTRFGNEESQQETDAAYLRSAR